MEIQTGLWFQVSLLLISFAVLMSCFDMGRVLSMSRAINQGYSLDVEFREWPDFFFVVE